MALRESLLDLWEWPGGASAQLHLKAWCSWAIRSRLPAFKKLGQTIKNHWDGILAYYPHRITSATIESINAIIQTARRRARSFRNFENLEAICYWMVETSTSESPQLLPTQSSEAPLSFVPHSLKL